MKELKVRGTRWFTPDGKEIRTEWESTPALWFAYLPDEYDGAPDAGPQLIGQGNTEAEAVFALIRESLEREEDDNATA